MNRDGEWHKSTASAYDGNCLLVRPDWLTVSISDSKDPDGPVLRFSPDAFRAFVAAAKGEVPWVST